MSRRATFVVYFLYNSKNPQSLPSCFNPTAFVTMQPDPSAYHCAICLLKQNPLDTLNGSTIAKIIAQGRPTPALPGLSKECRYKGKVFTRRFKKDNYFRYNWLSGCGVENKLFCWPCYIFSTDPTDTWGFKGFDGLSNFSNSVKTHLNQELHILNIEKYNVYASAEHKIWSERLPMQQPSFTISRQKLDVLPDLPMVAAINNYSEEADEDDDDDVEVIRHSDVMVELVDDSEVENMDRNASMCRFWMRFWDQIMFHCYLNYALAIKGILL